MAKRKEIVNKVPQKYFITENEFQHFIETEREWMFNRIVNSIEHAFINNELRAHILEANIEEKMSTMYMDSDVSEWDKSLRLALEWFEKHEDYEKCAKIFELIEKIKI
jgi:hypothetical protein